MTWQSARVKPRRKPLRLSLLKCADLTGHRAAVIVGVAIAMLIASPLPAAHANPCSNEQQKFIQGRTPTTASSDRVYGTMATHYVYYRWLGSCGATANTAFILLTTNATDYVEVGTHQLGPSYADVTGPDHYRLFLSYRDYPADTVVFEQPILRTVNEYVSFNVSNTSGTAYTWKGQYSYSGQSTGWSTLGTTPTMLVNRGYAHSEISRYGDAEAVSYQKDLKYRPSTGGWFGWSSLTCSALLPNSITNWDARGLSPTSWDSVAGTPPSGDC